MNYYNDNDPKAAAWLRELIKQKLIPDGTVDERSIADVTANDLRNFVQCHFFAGIAGWSYALQLAGWPSDRPVWTGSCPCQPFSVAGKGLGEKDERHLWPEFARLIGECRPPTVFGEQVSSKAGRLWLAGVRTDLEKMGYAVGALDTCAAGIGAPHIRQRLYWVADAGHQPAWRGAGSGETESGRALGDASGCGPVGGMADTSGGGLGIGGSAPGSAGHPDECGADRRMGSPILTGLEGHTGHEHNRSEPRRLGAEPHGPTSAAGGVGGVGDTNGTGPFAGRAAPEADGHGGAVVADGCHGGMGDASGSERRPASERRGHDDDRTNAGREETTGGPRLHGAWSDYQLIPCRDGKTRRIKSGLQPLVARLPRDMVPGGDHGIASDPKNTPEERVARLRGYGNSIVPQVAAEFVIAFLETSGNL